jgi:gas vesicle protein
MFVTLDAGAEVTIAIAKFIGTLIGSVALVLIKPLYDRWKIDHEMKRSLRPSPQLPPSGGNVDEPDTKRRPLTGPELDVLREDRLRAEAERLRDLAEQQGRTIEALKDSLGHSRVRMAEQEARIADLEARLKDQAEIDSDIRRMIAAVATAESAREAAEERAAAAVAELAGKRHDQRSGYTSLPSLPPAAITVPPALPPMPVRVVEIDGRASKATPAQGTRPKR